MDGNAKKIAESYLKPKICRHCYASVNNKATKCRKCNSSDLRIRRRLVA